MVTVQQIQRPYVVSSPTAPASPFEGQIWFDETSGTTKQYQNGSWVSIQQAIDEYSILQTSSGALESVSAIKAEEWNSQTVFSGGAGTVVDISIAEDEIGVLHSYQAGHMGSDDGSVYVDADTDITVDGNTLNLPSASGGYFLEVHNAPTILFEDSLRIVLNDGGENGGADATGVYRVIQK